MCTNLLREKKKAKTIAAVVSQIQIQIQIRGVA